MLTMGPSNTTKTPQSHSSSPPSQKHLTTQSQSRQDSIASNSSTTKPEKPQKTFLQKLPSYLLAFLKDQWFLFGVALVVIIASQVQVPPSQQATKQVVSSYLSISIIFFITGCTIDTKILFANYSKWRHHLFIQLECFLVVSALAFAIVSLAAINRNFLDPWLLIGLIFNGCGPTTMASNVMYTRQSHGNAALTIVETTIGNFLGPFLTPVLIKMYLLSGAWYTKAIPAQGGGYQALYRRVFMELGLSIYLPMVVGQVIRNIFPKTTKKVFTDWKLSKLGSLGLLTLLWQTFDHAFGTGAFRAVKRDNLVFIVFISIINYGIWLAVAMLTSFWLPRKDRVSAAMCVPAKTLALSVPLSFLLFEGITPLEEATIQVPLVLFQILQLGMASLSTFAFRRWVDREDLAKNGGPGGKTGSDMESREQSGAIEQEQHIHQHRRTDDEGPLERLEEKIEESGEKIRHGETVQGEPGAGRRVAEEF